ncbi:MAG: response regulator transcription factor [Anaerolineae bacterium]|nr:response regulator transcription factor [Gemmatimonadaceae bacterium]
MISHQESGQHILVIEDDDQVRTLLIRLLSDGGYVARGASDGESGLQQALSTHPDLVLVDVDLPLKSGVELTRELRQKGFRVPMLMLTAHASVSDRVNGLNAGADDYLPKPFESDELLARIKALLRRASMQGVPAIRVGEMVLDPISREVTRGAVPIELTQTEYALLEYLMRNPGRAIARSELGEHVWKSGYDPGTNIVDVYINYLRKKLGDDRRSPMIRTIRGVGYELGMEEVEGGS